MSRRATPEGALLRTVGDLLTAERVFWCRMNTGSIVVGDGPKRRCFTSGRKGMADILALPRNAWCGTCNAPPLRVPRTDKCGACMRHPGRIVLPAWIELKSARGVQSPHQREFQREVEAEGHIYIVVRSVDDITKWLHR